MMAPPEVSGKIRLLVVDDHVIARTGLGHLVSFDPAIQVVAQAASGAEAISKYDPEDHDVVIMDLRMKDYDGVQTTAAIRRRHPTARILVLSSFDSEIDILRARDAGALGFAMKESPPEALIQAIRTVAAGQTYVPSAIARRMKQLDDARLGARDLQLLRLMAEGLTEREMAERLDLTQRTVNNYIFKLLRRMGAKNRAAAIYEAGRLGII